LGVQ
jgi:hypothetical protein